jgi:hypothetical protein
MLSPSLANNLSVHRGEAYMMMFEAELRALERVEATRLAPQPIGLI